MRSALLVGFDFAVRHDFLRILGEPHPARETDPVADLLGTVIGHGRTSLGRMLAAAWRAALLAVAEGVPPDEARTGLAALALDDAAPRSGGS